MKVRIPLGVVHLKKKSSQTKDFHSIRKFPTSMPAYCVPFYAGENLVIRVAFRGKREVILEIVSLSQLFTLQVHEARPRPFTTSTMLATCKRGSIIFYSHELRNKSRDDVWRRIKFSIL